MKKKRTILIAGLVTLIGFGGTGILLMVYAQDKNLQSIFFNAEFPVLQQLLIGFLFGLIASLLLLLLLKRKMLNAARYYFAGIVKDYRVNYADIIFLSFCAGVGEELFFRGALQFWLGIWITSFIFILLHGYLNPKDLPLFIYGTVLLVVSSGFGYLMAFAGIFSAMAAHFLIDVVLINYLKKR